jgi:starch phosphorylase
MKFSMNGALTIGTLDGANIEIRNEVGTDNFFLFGLAADQVNDKLSKGYNPKDNYNLNEELRDVIDLISSGTFSNGDTSLFKPLIDNLLDNDSYLALADYQAYITCQEHISEAWKDRSLWMKKSILNVSRMGKFSSNRAIKEYCQDIWKITEKTL